MQENTQSKHTHELALEIARDEIRDELGMTTAEYTVGTLGACSIAAILIKLAHKTFYKPISGSSTHRRVKAFH